MAFSVSSDVHDQYRDALHQQDSAHIPFFTCPLCQKCPVCSVAASTRRHQQQSDLSLSMPNNWTSTFTSPRRKGQTHVARTLLRADSTQSITPQQNSKTMKLLDNIQEQQQSIEHLQGVLEDHKAELNLMTNKLQYANVEIKQLKGKMSLQNGDIKTLTAQVREMEEELRQSRARETATQRRLTLSESCRSNTTKELARCRQQNKQKFKHNHVDKHAGKLVKEGSQDSFMSIARESGSGTARRQGGCEGECSDSEEVEECVDISDNKDVVIKSELTALMSQISEWNTSGILPEMKGESDWLEHIYSQLQAINAKI